MTAPFGDANFRIIENYRGRVHSAPGPALPPAELDRWTVEVRGVSCKARSVRLVSAVELGLGLILLGRSLTRLYLGIAVERFGPSAAVLARDPDSDLVPTWVSVILLSGWAIAPSATVMLVLS